MYPPAQSVCCSRSRTRPVALADVVAALVAALDVPLRRGGAVADLPGPEELTVREILERAGKLVESGELFRRLGV